MHATQRLVLEIMSTMLHLRSVDRLLGLCGSPSPLIFTSKLGPASSSPCCSAFSISFGRGAEEEMASFLKGVGLPDASSDRVLGVSSPFSVGDGERPDMALVGGAQYVGCQGKGFRDKKAAVGCCVVSMVTAPVNTNLIRDEDLMLEESKGGHPT